MCLGGNSASLWISQKGTNYNLPVTCIFSFSSLDRKFGLKILGYFSEGTACCHIFQHEIGNNNLQIIWYKWYLGVGNSNVYVNGSKTMEDLDNKEM